MNWNQEWSMRLGVLSGACFAAATAYGTFSGIAPKLVEGVPQTILTGIVVAAMALGAAGVLVRGIEKKQATLPKPTVPQPKGN